MRFKLINELDDHKPLIAIESNEVDDDFLECILESGEGEEEDGFLPLQIEFDDGFDLFIS